MVWGTDPESVPAKRESTMATTKRTNLRSAASRANVNMAKASTRTRRVLGTKPRTLAFAVGAALFPWTFLSPVLAQTTANMLPTGGHVTAASAPFSARGNNLQIHQYSQNPILPG